MYPVPRGPLSRAFVLLFAIDAFVFPSVLKGALWPDLVVLGILLFVCFESSAQALVIAWAAGLARDILGSSPCFGAETAALSVSTLLVILLARKVDRQKAAVFAALAVVASAGYSIAFWMLLDVMRPTDAPLISTGRILGSILLTGFFAPVFVSWGRRFVSPRSAQYELFSEIWR